MVNKIIFYFNFFLEKKNVYFYSASMKSDSKYFYNVTKKDFYIPLYFYI